MNDAQLWKAGFDLASIVTSLMIIGVSILIYFSENSPRKFVKSKKK